MTFNLVGKIKLKTSYSEVSINLSEIEEGTNLFQDFIVYKDESLKVFTRRCDHNGGRLCNKKGKIVCPMHGWEFNPEKGRIRKCPIR